MNTTNTTKQISRAIYDANKNQEPVKINMRLTNGRFASVEGTVESIKVSRDGLPYITVNNPNNSRHKWQNVRLNNVLSVKNGKKTTRRSNYDT